MVPGESGRKLSEMIKKAIDDGKLTTTEYENILALAHEDGRIDPVERGLLSSLQDMIADGSIKRVRD